MNTKLKIAFAATLIATVTTSANAASYGNASLTPINFTLIDLNPSDSIAPSITWLDHGGGWQDTSAYNFSDDTAAANHQGDSGTGYDAFRTFVTSSNTALSNASTSITSGINSNSPQGASAAANGSAMGTTLPGYNSSYVASTYDLSYFSLSPYTQVLFNSTAHSIATTSVGYQPSWGGESAYTYAQLVAFDAVTYDTTGSAPDESKARLVAFADYAFHDVWNAQTQQYERVYNGQQQDLTDQLTVSYSNSTGEDKTGYMQAYTYTYGISHVSSQAAPVPEANTYAMMITGLGFMGFVARRRKS